MVLVCVAGLVLLGVTASQPHREGELSLTVESGTVPIGLGGAFDQPLRPGTTRYLDLTFHNPSAWDVAITSVSVSIVAVTAPHAVNGLSCLATDFVGSSGRLTPVVVGAGQSVVLSGSGAPQATWPSVHLVNASVNQDGCKGATITVGYSAVGEVR